MTLVLRMKMEEEGELNAQILEASLVELNEDETIVKGDGYIFFFENDQQFFDEADALSADVAYVAQMLIDNKVLINELNQVLVLDEVEVNTSDMETAIPAFLMKLDDYCGRFNIKYITFMHAAICKEEDAVESYLEIFKQLGYETILDQENGHYILHRNTTLNAPYHA